VAPTDHDAPMALRRLEGADAFVVTDLDDVERHAGLGRCAPKVLADSAWLLARCATYQYAVLERPVGGASVGINAKGEGRDEAVATAVGILAGDTPPLVLDAGRGLTDEDLAPLHLVDGRSDDHRSERIELTAAGIVAALSSQRPLDGLRLSVEHLDDLGVAVVRRAVAAGARLVAVDLGGTVVASADGLDPEAVAAARTDGDGPGGLPATDKPLLAIDADAVGVGSKLGAVDHNVAGDVAAGIVLPLGWAPVTTRALAVLTRRGTTVLPDFVVLAGAVPGSGVGGPVAPDPLAAAGEVVGGLCADLGGDVGDDWPNLVLAACARAEAFLTGAGHTLPTSRPLG
jgi:glutamate dehydrogenase (NAD(P)+)